MYLWRAVDQVGEVGDVFLQSRRDGKAAKGTDKLTPGGRQWRDEQKN